MKRKKTNNRERKQPAHVNVRRSLGRMYTNTYDKSPALYYIVLMQQERYNERNVVSTEV